MMSLQGKGNRAREAQMMGNSVASPLNELTIAPLALPATKRPPGSRVEAAPSDLKPFDPYEVAYLRGGEREVVKLCLFDLLQRGYLEVRETKKWLSTVRQLAAVSNPPPPEDLSEGERQLVS